jgi:hypothetical protein
VSRSLRLTLLLAAVSGLLAGGGSAASTAGAESASPAPAAATGTAGAGEATAARRRRRHHRRRPGCSKYCRQAGGFGGGPDEPGPVRIKRQKIRVDRDGIIGVRATCARDKKCVGAILVDGYNASYGRADLRVKAHKTRTVYVYVPRKGRRYLKRHGGDKHAFATVPLKDNAPLSIGDELTLLPHR